MQSEISSVDSDDLDNSGHGMFLAALLFVFVSVPLLMAVMALQVPVLPTTNPKKTAERFAMYSLILCYFVMMSVIIGWSFFPAAVITLVLTLVQEAFIIVAISFTRTKRIRLLLTGVLGTNSIFLAALIIKMVFFRHLFWFL